MKRARTRANQNLTEQDFDTIINQASATTSVLPPTTIMYSAQAWIEPTLQWDLKWPYTNAKPNPITVAVARKHLACAFAHVRCLGRNEAKSHGHAWMVETEETWKKREGVTTVIEPFVQPEEPDDYTVESQIKFARADAHYQTYIFLRRVGQKKLIEWFGINYFADLYVNDALPVATTPATMLKHMATTYCKVTQYRQAMKQVRTLYNSSFEVADGVENYFATLQDVSLQSGLLEEPYSSAQLMTRALEEFESVYGSDAAKADDKWTEKSADEKTWEAFKIYWKDAIEKINTFKQANVKQANMLTTVEHELGRVLQAMNVLTRENQTLKQQQVHQANQLTNVLQRAPSMHTPQSNDDVSVLTDMVTKLETRLAKLDNRTLATTSLSKSKGPRAYEDQNDGKGRCFNSYCWKCGCNGTHWTRRCRLISNADKQKYAYANFEDRLGGSTKFLDRRNKYQSDYSFDSL